MVHLQIITYIKALLLVCYRFCGNNLCQHDTLTETYSVYKVENVKDLLSHLEKTLVHLDILRENKSYMGVRQRLKLRLLKHTLRVCLSWHHLQHVTA